MKPVPPQKLKVEPSPEVLKGLGPLAPRALAHWKEHQPRLVQELQASGHLRAALERAVNQTNEAVEQLLPDLRKQGYSEEQAERHALELVEGEWLLPPPEIPEHERKDRDLPSPAA